MFSLFGKGDKYYLNHLNDNRIHIYDINNNKQLYNYIEKNYLLHNYLCSKWLQNNKNDIGIYSVGTSDGLIIIWDFKRGVVMNTIGIKNENILPSDIIYNNDNKHIIVSYSTSSQINEYDITTGNLIKTYKGFKKGTQKLAKNPISSSFVAVSGTIKYFDNDKSSKFKISTSFSGNVTSVNFTNCGNYLICTLSGSHNSDDLVIYNFSPDVLTTATNDPSFTIEPICSYPINGSVKSISLTNSTSTNIHQLLCLFSDNTTSIIHLPMNDILNKNFNTIKQIQLVSNVDNTPVNNIIAVTFPSTTQNDSTNDKYHFILATGKYSSPQFFKHSYNLNEIHPITSLSTEQQEQQQQQLFQLSIPFNNNSTTTSTTTTTATTTTTTANDNDNGNDIINSNTETTVIGPYETGATKRPFVALEDNIAGGNVNGNNNNNNNSNNDNDNDLNSNSKKKLKLTQENNLTLEERLRNIHTTLTQLETNPSFPGDIDGNGNRESNNKLSSSLLPTSDSLVLLLEQALQTSDDVLFEQCLSQSSVISATDLNIITETVQRLSLSKILVLLNKLILKFNKNSSRSLIITRWIYTILKQHSSYLLSVSNLNQQLAALYNMLENRLNIYVKLASLNGRLDLIMSQIISSSDRNDKESNSKDNKRVHNNNHNHNKNNNKHKNNHNNNQNNNQNNDNNNNNNNNNNQKKNNKKPKQILYEE